mmetsp:Transcript_16576/g.26263  ORF Transcript_16576/g.26263 Transcript_16576/m.26263 type:complete len:146 (+) Transcript_16576:695-1132(+)
MRGRKDARSSSSSSSSSGVTEAKEFQPPEYVVFSPSITSTEATAATTSSTSPTAAAMGNFDGYPVSVQVSAVKFFARILGIVRIFESDKSESWRVASNPNRANFSKIAKEVLDIGLGGVSIEASDVNLASWGGVVTAHRCVRPKW